MRPDSSAEDLGRRPRIQTATILPPAIITLDDGDSEGTDVETLVNTHPGEERAPSLIPITITDDDLLPIDGDESGTPSVQLVDLDADNDEEGTVQGPTPPFFVEIDEDEDEEHTARGTERPALDISHGDTEASVVVASAKPGGYDLLRGLATPALGELFVAEKPMYFGIPRRAYLRRLPRTTPGYEDKRRHVLREARTGAAFHHPSLVAVTHAGEDEHGVHVAYEHVDGTNLTRVNRLLRERGEAMPFEIVAWIVADVLRGLHHAHELVDERGRPKNLVIGGLGPDTVLLSRTGQAKLATFSLTLARSGDPEAACQNVADSGAYAAPEVAIRSEWTVRSDVYAIGLMLFELLAGRACFPRTSFDTIPIDVLREEEVPPGLIEIVGRATHHLPGERFDSAASMAAALNAWIHESGRHAMPSLVSRFFEKHDLFESADGAYGPLLSDVAAFIARPELGSRERPPVDALFSHDTREDISIDGSGPPEDTLSAMIISERVDPEAAETIDPRPVDSVIVPPPPPPKTLMPHEPVVATEPGHVEPVSALHRIRRGPRPLTVGLIIGAALLAGVLVSLTVSLATRDASPPTLIGEQVE